MHIRNVIFCIVLFSIVSCDYFSFTRKNNNQYIDTIINLSKVDVSPSFEKCKELDSNTKNECFRSEIQANIARSLSEIDFIVDEDIDEVIYVHLVINNYGTVQLKDIEASNIVLEKLPALDSLLKVSVKKLPKIFPAIKRGIPVTTQYTLPVKIAIKNY
ncbi:hypothetical protein [Tenacibaculum sp. nBUS_03]|uniref:hypothetical protein n=1 Tax=Tenacibaculum sp. nBUS_03 TaxID=3395320 RepID=UPI003EC07B91